MPSASLRATPPHAVLTFNGDFTAQEYRSVPGRGVQDRRIDVSSGFDLLVKFYRVTSPGWSLLGTFILDGGVPLIWPVPAGATYEDVLVVVEPFLPDDGLTRAGAVYIGDHWGQN